MTEAGKPQRLEHRHQADQLQETETRSTRQFESVEELLQYDAAQTPVPERVADRLRESLAGTPPPHGGRWGRWWRRLRGRADSP